MATKNIVPRATGEGSLGTSTKKWGNIYADNITLNDDETLATKITNIKETADGAKETADGAKETADGLSSKITTNTNNITTLSNNKMNKSGDTMTGSLLFDNGGTIRSNTDTSIVILRGSTAADKGGSIALYGKDYATEAYQGIISLIASNGTNTSYLRFYPDSTATIGSANIETVVASGTGYIRYASGLQICWGGASISAETSFTFAKAFNATPTVTSSCTANKLAYLTALSATSATFACANYSSYVRYIAVGTWK